MFQSYYFFKYESVLIPYYLSIKHSFRTWQFSINFFPKFSPKRKLVKTKNILNEFYFLVLFADSSRCHKLPYNVRAVVSGRQCCATSAIKSIRGPVACSNRRKGGEKKKKKAESKRIYLLLVLRVHNENNQALRVDASLYARDSLERISSRLVKGVVILKFSTENVRWIDSCIS